MTLSFPIYRLKRQAKLLARDSRIPLNLALDQIAHKEGFRSWSHLSASQSQAPSAAQLLNACTPGEVMLIAARPGQGKTLLAIELLQEAVKQGRGAWFFTLEYGRADLTGTDLSGIRLDTSDDICASHIAQSTQTAQPGALVVIDYLQLLDQRRDFPPLADQVDALRHLALTRQITLIALSQIDRSFDTSGAAIPGLQDLRLPNPIDLSHIAKTCFLHDGKARIASHTR